MDTISYSAFRKNLKYYLNQVNEDATTLLITNRDSDDDTAVVMSKRDYDSMTETLRVMSNSELMAKLRQGRAQIDNGTTQHHELVTFDDQSLD